MQAELRGKAEHVEVPQRNRTAGTYRHLAKLMAALGWTAARVRDLGTISRLRA